MSGLVLDIVGDICLGFENRRQTARFGHDYPFDGVRETLKGADLVFGNLEMFFSRNHEANGKSDLWAGNSAFEGIPRAGFNVLNLANNHIMDAGAAGYENTRELLNARGLWSVGAGRNAQEARKPLVVDCENIRIGFLAYADDEGQIAGRNRPGTNELAPERVLADIHELKKRSDVVIVSFHTGIEFAAYPSPFQVQLSRKAIEAGADVVLGNHPHVVQGIERYGNGLICYSLGNFIFQVHGNEYQMPSFPYSAWGIIVKINITPEGYAGHTIVPVIIGEEHRPRLADPNEACLISEHIEAVSAGLSDPDLLSRSYRQVCRFTALSNYWFMRTMLRQLKVIQVIRHFGVLAGRAPNRRWIRQYLRGVCIPSLPEPGEPVSVYDRQPLPGFCGTR